MKNTRNKRKVLVEVTSLGAVCLDGTRITGRSTKWGIHYTVCSSTVKIPVGSVRQFLEDNGYGKIHLVPEYCAEFGI